MQIKVLGLTGGFPMTGIQIVMSKFGRASLLLNSENVSGHTQVSGVVCLLKAGNHAVSTHKHSPTALLLHFIHLSGDKLTVKCSSPFTLKTQQTLSQISFRVALFY